MDYSQYDDIFQMALHMYERSDEYAMELRNGQLSYYIAKTDKSKAEKLDKLIPLSYPDDVLVYKAMFIINPYMSIRINSYAFDDYKDLGSKMLETSPNCNPILLQLVHHALISYHMEITLADKDNPELYQKIKENELLSEDDMQLAYFRIAYLLSGKTSIIYNHVEYKNIFNLAYYLCNKENDLNDIGTYLADSAMLKAYLEIVPQGKLSDEYLHLCKVSDKSEDDLERFLERRKNNRSV